MEGELEGATTMHPFDVDRAATPRLSVALREIRRGFGAGVGPSRAVREMRRFVPDPLRERIARGESVDLGELRVAVLAGELRGYTSYAAHHRPREAFALLSRFGEELDAGVRELGGELCEYSGEGLLAVFAVSGAVCVPEQAAFAAALRICTLVAEHAERMNEPCLSAALGIATGEAYLGGIRTGERIYWSAVGETTKRASRLRALARERGMAVALDGETRRALGAAEELRAASTEPLDAGDRADELSLLAWGAP